MIRVNKRRVTYGGRTYYAQREALARDGGDPPRQWYWVIEDERDGACIDERVPEGYFSTLGKAKTYLAQFLGCGVEDLKHEVSSSPLSEPSPSNVSLAHEAEMETQTPVRQNTERSS